MRYVDSSRVAADWVCPKARYWGYHHGGIGLATVEPNSDLQFGLAIAEGVEILRSAPKDWGVKLEDSDAAVLAAGLLVAYKLNIWPKWVDEYELVATELECLIKLSSDVTYMARPDAVLKRRSDGTVWVLSDKTTSLNPENFLRIWDKAAQNHAECIAVEHTLGLTVSGFLTQGWYKGYKKLNTIYSPLCYGWAREGTVGLTATQWSAEYKAGWTRRRISEFPGGVEAWVKKLPKEVINNQFPLAGPFMVRRDLVKEYLAQVLHREQTITLAEGGLEVVVYPKHFSNCDDFSKYHRACEFKECCWSGTVGRDPIGSGLYKRREPHHKIELEAVNK